MKGCQVFTAKHFKDLHLHIIRVFSSEKIVNKKGVSNARRDRYRLFPSSNFGGDVCTKNL